MGRCGLTLLHKLTFTLLAVTLLASLYNFMIRDKAIRLDKKDFVEYGQANRSDYLKAVQLEKKDFVYLIQSNKPRCEPRLVHNERRHVLYLCFVEGCDVSHVPYADVRVQTGLWWSGGRNSLLDHAIERAARMPDGGYEYYIFLDEDMQEEVIGDAPWDLFEDWLTQTRPAIGYFTNSAPWQSTHKGAPFNIDANINAFHRTTLGAALPVDLSLDDQGSYFSQHSHNLLVGAVFASQRRGFKGVEFNGKKNVHSYPASRRSQKWRIPKLHMDSVFREDTPMHQAVVRMNCNQTNDDKYCQYEQCPMQPLTGPIDEAWWKQNANVYHPFVSSKVEFLRKHSKFLEKLRGMHGGFIPSTAWAPCHA